MTNTGLMLVGFAARDYYNQIVKKFRLQNGVAQATRGRNIAANNPVVICVIKQFVFQF